MSGSSIGKISRDFRTWQTYLLNNIFGGENYRESSVFVRQPHQVPYAMSACKATLSISSNGTLPETFIHPRPILRFSVVKNISGFDLLYFVVETGQTFSKRRKFNKNQLDFDGMSCYYCNTDYDKWCNSLKIKFLKLIVAAGILFKDEVFMRQNRRIAETSGAPELMR